MPSVVAIDGQGAHSGRNLLHCVARIARPVAPGTVKEKPLLLSRFRSIGPARAETGPADPAFA